MNNRPMLCLGMQPQMLYVPSRHAMQRVASLLQHGARELSKLGQQVHLFTEIALLQNLEPHLQDLVRRAFTDTIRMVALDLKHGFERELNKQLDARLRNLVSECVRRACSKTRI